MATQPIPIIEASGAHREVGHQIGEKLKPRIQRGIAEMHGETFPLGVSWDDLIQKARLCLVHSRAAYPHLVEEMEGLAEGAGVPFEEAFLGLCEELWEPAGWRAKGCTDFAARGRATVNGATLIAHTNDVSPNLEEELVIMRIRVTGEPEFLGIGFGGLGFSAGFNAAGISLTGNMVWCNDIRPGVPRMLIVRAILGARRLGEAIQACLLPTRASNYNNVIADQNGEIYSMEGSATDCEPIYIEGDILAHANHFASPPMRAFEADRSAIACSVIRHNRAWRLLRENFGQLSPELFRKLLADHVNYPDSICRHSETVRTVFSIIIDLGRLTAWIGRGRPCETTFVEHTLEPWSPPGDWPQ